MWRPSTVQHLLQYSAVAGTLTTNASGHSQAADGGWLFPCGRGRGDLQHRASDAAVGQKLPKGRHAVDQTVRNVLAGLGRCPLCDTMHVEGDESAWREGLYLICDGARYQTGCTFRSVRSQAVEDALVADAERLTGIAEIAAGGPVLADLETVETHISVTEDELGNLLDALARDPSPAIRERIRETEDSLDRDASGGSGAWAQRAALSAGPMVAVRLERLREALTAETVDATGGQRGA